MSLNITPNLVIGYITEVLNLNTENKLVLLDVQEDLKSIHDLALFRVFIKDNFSNPEYKYLTGYQKFLALTNDFKKANKPRLNIDQKVKAQNYTEILFKKTVDVFDWINWEVQVGCDLYDKKISQKLFKVFGDESKDLQVLEQIGKRPELLRLVNNHKELLREKIEKIVFRLTLEKHHPQLAHKSSEKLVLERLKKGVK